MKDLKIFTSNIEQKAKEQIDLLMEQDAYKDKNGKIVQLWYSGQSHNFKVIKICNTEEEAKSLIKQLRENRCNG